jgi:hypothetical protein
MTDDAARTELPQAAPRRWVRGVRIGTSVFFGLLTVVLVVLWVRSYWTGGYIYWNLWKHRSVLVGLSHGQIVIHTELFTMGQQRLRWISTGRASSSVFRWRPLPSLLGRRIWNGFQFVIPGWCVAVVTAAVAMTCWPWCCPRFSLRTMFIATTLLAVSLGAVLWASG